MPPGGGQAVSQRDLESWRSRHGAISRALVVPRRFQLETDQEEDVSGRMHNTNKIGGPGAISNVIKGAETRLVIPFLGRSVPEDINDPHADEAANALLDRILRDMDHVFVTSYQEAGRKFAASAHLQIDAMNRSVLTYTKILSDVMTDLYNSVIDAMVKDKNKKTRKRKQPQENARIMPGLTRYGANHIRITIIPFQVVQSSIVEKLLEINPHPKVQERILRDYLGLTADLMLDGEVPIMPTDTVAEEWDGSNPPKPKKNPSKPNSNPRSESNPSQTQRKPKKRKRKKTQVQDDEDEEETQETQTPKKKSSRKRKRSERGSSSSSSSSNKKAQEDEEEEKEEKEPKKKRRKTSKSKSNGSK